MQFCSTRNTKISSSLSDAVLTGLVPDGGLFFPSEIPIISSREREAFSRSSFVEVAQEIFRKFSADEFSQSEIQEIMKSAYSQVSFSNSNVAPVRKLSDDTFLLELFHGPTGAFKDFALQFLPRVMQLSLLQKSLPECCILVATSGDTGGAALAGYADVPGTRCIVFFPKGGVSPLQQAQMQCAQGKNILTLEVSGDFDNAQAIVKEIFTDEEYAQELSEKYNISLSSANSINIGRLIPQTFYTFYAHAQMVRSGEISGDEEVDICVPTGNFGDLFAAFLAKQMGLPLGHLICASNQNNTSAEFIETGIFDIRNRSTEKTISPAMDILKASNLERLLFFSSHQDSQKVSAWMKQLQDEGYFQVDSHVLQKIQKDFSGEFISDAETAEEIRNTFSQYQYLPDPHTAVALSALRKHRHRTGSQNKTLVYSTAHFGKFGEAVFSALHPNNPLPKTEKEILHFLGKEAPTPSVPDYFYDIFNKEVCHQKYVHGDLVNMKKAIIDFLL